METNKAAPVIKRVPSLDTVKFEKRVGGKHALYKSVDGAYLVGRFEHWQKSLKRVVVRYLVVRNSVPAEHVTEARTLRQAVAALNAQVSDRTYSL